MARSRMIKPDFWDDEKLSTKTSRDARLVFIALWNFSDDYGVVKGNTTWLKNNIFPYEDSLSPHEFEKWLSELENIDLIYPFFYNGEKYYHILNFLKHQKINRPSKARNPEPNQELKKDSQQTHGGLMEDSVSINCILTDETEVKQKVKQKGKQNNCSEQKNFASEPEKKIFITLTLNDKSEHPVYEKNIPIYENLYPAVDVRQELRKMKGWCMSNPKKRKTSAGIDKFITSWLAKEQDAGGIYKNQTSYSQNGKVIEINGQTVNKSTAITYSENMKLKEKYNGK